MHTPFTHQAFPIGAFVEHRLLRQTSGSEMQGKADQLPNTPRGERLGKAAGAGNLNRAAGDIVQGEVKRTNAQLGQFEKTSFSPPNEFPPLTKQDREGIEKAAGNLPENIRGMTVDLVSGIQNPEIRKLALGIIILVAIFTKLRASQEPAPQFGTSNPNTGTNTQQGTPGETPANRIDQAANMQAATNTNFEAAQKSVEGTPPNRANQGLVKIAQGNVQTESKAVNALLGPPALTDEQRKLLNDAQRKILTELSTRQKRLEDMTKQLEGFSKLAATPTATPVETPQEQLKKQTALTDTALEAARKSMVMSPAPAPLFLLPSFDRGMVQSAQKQVDAEIALIGRLPADQPAQKGRMELLQKAQKELTGFAILVREAAAAPTVAAVTKAIEAAINANQIPDATPTSLDIRLSGIQCQLGGGRCIIGGRTVIIAVDGNSMPLQAIQRMDTALTLRVGPQGSERTEQFDAATLAQAIVTLSTGATFTRNGPPRMTMTPQPL